MGNKPHRLKKMKMKALRKFSKIDVSKKATHETIKTHNNMLLLKPFNKKTASEMLKAYKKTIEHIHLKNKPHHHKRTTPGTVDEEAPQTIIRHHNIDKSMKKWHKGDIQKSAEIGRKFIHSSWKKAA